MWSAVAPAGVAGDVVPFNSDRWNFQNAEFVTYLDRQSLMGTALLEDVDFGDGVIEVDMAIENVRTRSYPGLIFRARPQGHYEQFYVRPHRSPIYPDTLQYTPAFNGVAGWQLYSGEGFTALGNIPEKQWFRVKMEIKGSQARIFIDDAEEPALVIPRLKHGTSTGAIGVTGPADGTAYFSNFRYRADENLQFTEPPELPKMSGVLTDWQISKAFDAAQIDADAYPPFFVQFRAEWQDVQSEPSGLIDVARYVPRTRGRADCVFARTTVRARRNRTAKLAFGYSDDVTLFLNGRPLFSGQSGYRSRDPSFVGVVGYNDTVHLPLEKGNNEIFLILSERFGGWGFMAKTERALHAPLEQHDAATKVWETDAVFRIPESVLHDPQRGVLYVTSYDKTDFSRQNTGFVSRLGLDGEILDLEWVSALDGPCGMGLLENRLYVVEAVRHTVVEIDVDSGQVVKRHDVPGASFLNDLAIDDSGAIYVSDTSTPARAQDIYRLIDGRTDVWKTGVEIHRANGLFVHKGQLLVGNSGDGLFKSIDLNCGHVTPIACLGGGIIDGIRVDNNDNYLVSHWKGQIYRITPDAEVTEILDLSGEGLPSADFEFVKDRNLLVIPTFYGNKVVAYRLSQGS
jgi:sugar lactone lactonase YvrE